MNPTPDTVMAALPALLERICRTAQPGLSPDMQLLELPGIDSLRLLQTIALLEEQFQVEVDVVALNDLATVHDIVQAIVTARPA